MERCILCGGLWFWMPMKRAGGSDVITGLLEPTGDSSEGYF